MNILRTRILVLCIGGSWHKNMGAPMVKIKDFTLASKNGGGGTCPQFLHYSLPRFCGRSLRWLPVGEMAKMKFESQWTGRTVPKWHDFTGVCLYFLLVTQIRDPHSQFTLHSTLVMLAGRMLSQIRPQVQVVCGQSWRSSGASVWGRYSSRLMGKC